MKNQMDVSLFVNTQGNDMDFHLIFLFQLLFGEERIGDDELQELH